MVEKKRLLLIGATFLIALGAGQLMQNGNAIAAKFSSDTTENNAFPALKTQAHGLSLPSLPQDMQLAQEPFKSVFSSDSRIIASNTTFDISLLQDQPVPGFQPLSCDPKFTALPSPGAMVRLSLNASCYKNQRIAIEHAGLVFSDIVSNEGTYKMDVPALQEDASFKIRFQNGQTVQANVLTLTLDGYERVAVMWSGAADLKIHAFENGASFGMPGHVWAGAPSDPLAGVNASGGFLTQLGNPNMINPQLAEVYSFPFDRMATEGGVELKLEATVSDRTCASQITARTVQLSGLGETTYYTLQLNFPDCGGENGFLVLNNLFQDLKIARN